MRRRFSTKKIVINVTKNGKEYIVTIRKNYRWDYKNPTYSRHYQGRKLVDIMDVEPVGIKLGFLYDDRQPIFKTPTSVYQEIFNEICVSHNLKSSRSDG